MPPTASAPAPSRDRWALLALALAAGLARWLTRSPEIYNWDSVNYILAQDRYSLPDHQPHPPGSLYYVLFARALGYVCGDPHTALLLLSSIFGSLLVVALYLLGQELGGRRAAWFAAAIGASAPLFWFYGSLGLNYAPAGALAALVALGCFQLCRGERTLSSALLAGIAFGLLGGFRPTDTAFLAPGCLHALLVYLRPQQSDPVRRAHAGASLAAAALLSLGWLVPNVLNAGGPARYLEGMRDLSIVFTGTSALLAGWPAFQDALYTHRRSLESAIGVPLLMCGAAWVLRSCLLNWRGGRDARAPMSDRFRCSLSPPLLCGVLLVLPAFLFYLLGHFNSPGYTLTYAGLLAAAAGACLARVTPPVRWASALAMALVIGLNAFAFLARWPGAPRLTQRSLARGEMLDHARYYRELRVFLDARHRPGGVVLLASWTGTDGLRVVQHLLPEHAPDTLLLVPRRPALGPEARPPSFLRLAVPEDLDRENRPIYAVARTREDAAHHAALFGPSWDVVPIGPEHWVYRLNRPSPTTTGRAKNQL